MRVKLTQTTPESRIILTGQETWLDSIYGDFATQDPAPGAAPISGHLTLSQDEDGAVKVEGQILFTPTVGCARCDKSIAWPLDVKVDATVLPEDHASLPRELNLHEQDLECYRMIGDEVDLEVLVNDAIQTALPSQFVATSEDGTCCTICGVDVSNDKVFSAGEVENTSPFAALRGLKLPK